MRNLPDVIGVLTACLLPCLACAHAWAEMNETPLTVSAFNKHDTSLLHTKLHADYFRDPAR